MLGIESLERRQLLSGITFDANEDVIHIVGTGHGDSLVAQAGAQGQITLTFNGQTQNIALDMFTSISISLGDGNDSIRVEATAPGNFIVDAGAGSDTVTIIGGDSLQDEIDIFGYLIALNGQDIDLESVENIVVDGGAMNDVISFFDLNVVPLKSLQVMGGDGNDALQFFDTKPFAGATINIVPGGGDDLIFYGDGNSVGGKTFTALPDMLVISGVGTIHHDATAELIFIGGGTLADTFRIRPGASTRYAIDAGGGLPNSPADTIIVQSSGALSQMVQFTSPGTGSVTASNRKPINFLRAEHILFASLIAPPKIDLAIKPTSAIDDLLA